jgi:hypothetical protein
LSGQNEGALHIVRRGRDFAICAPPTSACADTSRRRLQFSIFAARAITHRTSQKAELFCEICMMGQAAVMIVWNAMDAYYCWLFLETLMQLEGALRKRQICSSPFF